MAPREFAFSHEPEPHKGRTREILKKYPEIKKLYGVNPWTIVPIIGIVATQFAVAFFISQNEIPWWGILAMAWGFGAFANHSLFTLTHDCSHQLASKKKWVNIMGSIMCDMPNVVPTAISFKVYHMKHHSFQGAYDLDADIPNRWEAKLVGNFFLFKALWLLLYPVFQISRPPRMKSINFMSPLVLLNWGLIFAIDFCVIYFLGWSSFLYFFASFFFSVGLHPLGARWIQEHYLTSPPQETYSYYGPLNWICFNIGYHNEHHDFPGIPWSRLPKVREIAPEYYDTLEYHTSWSRLLLKFIFDPKISLHSRMLRENKSKNRNRNRKRKPEAVQA
ncbi:MAG: fatty acid desaturase [Bacteroidota bacterium]